MIMENVQTSYSLIWFGVTPWSDNNAEWANYYLCGICLLHKKLLDGYLLLQIVKYIYIRNVIPMFFSDGTFVVL